MPADNLAVLDSLRAIAVVVDPHGAIVDWTHQFLGLIDRQPHELRGCLLWEFASQDDRDCLRRMLIEAANDRESRRVDVVMVAGSGGRRVAWSCSPVSYGGGDSILAWAIDIDRKAEEALRVSEHKLRLSLQGAHLGTWQYDLNTGIFTVDEAGKVIHGLDPEEVIETLEDGGRHLHPDDIPGLRLRFEKAIAECGTHSHEYRVVHPEGETRWVATLGMLQPGTSSFFGIVQDVTERKRVELDLLDRQREQERRSYAELERRTLQLRRLASQLTLAEQHAREQLARTLHDGLQQLLFSARVKLDRAVKSDFPPDHAGLLHKTRADIDEAIEAARTLSVNLFPPILQVGGLPSSLAWLAKRTQDQFRIAVNLTADPRANPEASDVRILLFEAVRELLFNAVKHAHVDRVDVNLELRSDDTIHIDVSDKGIGFDPAAASNHENEHQSGLGLFSIRERFVLLGGHLGIQSAPGQGARFSLSVPRNDHRHGSNSGAAHIYEPGRRERFVPKDSPAAISQPLRILIADDHVVVRAGLRELFSERPGLQVMGEATNGLEAISQAVALQPEVIVMDVSMPKINGIDATREIHRTQPHIRIVGLSTYDDEISERSMREAGAEAYFTKNEGTDRLLDYLLSLGVRKKASAQRV
jgi:PAS domain S-box-containing protein